MIQTYNENGTNRSMPWSIGKNNYFLLKIRSFLQKHGSNRSSTGQPDRNGRPVCAVLFHMYLKPNFAKKRIIRRI